MQARLFGDYMEVYDVAERDWREPTCIAESIAGLRYLLAEALDRIAFLENKEHQ